MSGTVIISIDALFGLTRKKSAGISHTEPLNGNTYFINQVEVDKFVDSSPNSIQNNVMMCQYNYLLYCLSSYRNATLFWQVIHCDLLQDFMHLMKQV